MMKYLKWIPALGLIFYVLSDEIDKDYSSNNVGLIYSAYQLILITAVNVLILSTVNWRLLGELYMYSFLIGIVIVIIAVMFILTRK